MVCCVVLGCSVQPGMGKILHRFPRNLARRREWEVNVNRENWQPHNNSFICEKHFDENQYESGRADGLKKLKPNAVPTLFFVKENQKKMKCKNESKISLHPITEQLQVEHSYSISKSLSTHNESLANKNNGSNYTGADRHKFDSFITPSVSAPLQGEVVETVLTAEQVPSSDYMAKTRESELMKVIEQLKKQLLRERKEKHELVKDNNKIKKQKVILEKNLSRVFDKDQLASLSRRSSRGVQWSNKTITKALHLKFALGCKGYAVLLQHRLPFPSLRSLRRRIVHVSKVSTKC